MAGALEVARSTTAAALLLSQEHGVVSAAELGEVARGLGL